MSEARCLDISAACRALSVSRATLYRMRANIERIFLAFPVVAKQEVPPLVAVGVDPYHVRDFAAERHPNGDCYGGGFLSCHLWASSRFARCASD